MAGFPISFDLDAWNLETRKTVAFILSARLVFTDEVAVGILFSERATHCCKRFWNHSRCAIRPKLQELTVLHRAHWAGGGVWAWLCGVCRFRICIAYPTGHHFLIDKGIDISSSMPPTCK
jgi:hypothetical protein